jgi:Ser/Thr protein kinase RdoA (MazF antagonist)
MQSVPRHILELIGSANARFVPLSPRGHVWQLLTEDCTAILRSGIQTLEHVEWLHEFLDRLAASGFPCPEPMPILNSASIAAFDGQVWETLSFLPGRSMRLDDDVPLESAGALLARFHLDSTALAASFSVQRPQALPMEACRPRSHPRIAEEFQRELSDLGHHSATRCVVHGDCTVANTLVDEQAKAPVALIDFTRAHLGPPESDISFALWVNGRIERTDLTLDADRIRMFVGGYHRIRPLSAWVQRAIPLYLVGRGLQMQVRLEQAGVWDQIQVDRLEWLDAHRRWLEQVVASALQ